MNRLLVCLTALGVILCGCSLRLTPERLEARYGLEAQAPKIQKYGAVSRIRSGQSWRIFVAAEDPDGDMDAVVFELYQPGSGWLPGHTKKLKAEASGSFSGYFFLNTPRPVLAADTMWGLRLTLKFKIRDKAGHTSDTVALPVEFVGRKVEQPIPRGFTDEDVRALGPILINLFVEREERESSQ